MTRRIPEIPWIKHTFDNRDRPGPSRGTFHRVAGRTDTPLTRLTAVRSGGASRVAVAAIRCGPPALPRPGRAGLRRGYRLTGPCKLRINWVAAGVSAIEHLPFELRASTARMLNAYVPEPLIREYLPVPPVSL